MTCTLIIIKIVVCCDSVVIRTFFVTVRLVCFRIVGAVIKLYPAKKYQKITFLNTLKLYEFLGFKQL